MHFSRFRQLSLSLLLFVGMAQAEEITVSAAASLTNAFQEIARQYEAEYPDTRVLLNFGASGALLQQLIMGAPVDVFASADQETMDQAAHRQLLLPNSRVDFTHNQLVVITPRHTSLHLKQLADLQHAGLQRIAIGNPASVPAGRYSKRALEQAQLWDTVQAKAITTYSVRQALDYTARGEVEAAFVYASDAQLMEDRVRIAFTVPLDEAIAYPIALLSDSPHQAQGQRFIAYVQSPSGQATLARYGFLR